jgi:hypothetical protein
MHMLSEGKMQYVHAAMVIHYANLMRPLEPVKEGVTAVLPPELLKIALKLGKTHSVRSYLIISVCTFCLKLIGLDLQYIVVPRATCCLKFDDSCTHPQPRVTVGRCVQC